MVTRFCGLQSSGLFSVENILDVRVIKHACIMKRIFCQQKHLHIISKAHVVFFNTLLPFHYILKNELFTFEAWLGG